MFKTTMILFGVGLILTALGVSLNGVTCVLIGTLIILLCNRED